MGVTLVAPRIPAGSRLPWWERDPRPLTKYAWMDDGACVGQPSEIFFPDESDQSTIDRAKAICARCPIQQRCAEVALVRREPYGIWGGLSERDRRSILRRNRQTRK